MGVSPDVLESHILEWEAKLGPGYRVRWPSRLFRHESLENILQVLGSSRLLSRRDAANAIQRDVAPEVIISANAAAHGFARLYFRPRTPTQYRIEGIRRAEEIWNERHAPILYMLVFKSRDILVRNETRFSRGNMQASGAEVLDGDIAFHTLDFRKIYHEGSYPPEEGDIKVWRCAEVLCLSPVELDQSLEAIVCRSDAERKTLLHLLGDNRALWSPKIRTVTQPGYFEAKYAFVESVDLNSDALTVKFHARRHPPMQTWVQVSIQPLDNLLEATNFNKQELDLRKVWNFIFNPIPGRYRVKIWIDDEVAYVSDLEYGEIPF